MDTRSALLEGGDSGPAIVAGQPESSLLLQAIGRQPDVSAMPPAVDQSLSHQQVEDFRSWIAAGAFWPERGQAFASVKHWAFQPLVTGPVPQAVSDWCQTEVDAFVLRALTQAGQQPR
ncbi:MAG: c-type cytochrome domain-containing protein, partial [Planctomycetaceae bacterium]